MCLAKIYTNNKNFKTFSLIDVLDFSQYTDDINTPTLLIGKKNSEELIGKEKIKVLDREIRKNLYWTYSKVEKRNEYEKDVEEFYQSLFKHIKKHVHYKCIDLYNTSYSEIKNILTQIGGDNVNYIYVTDNHVYIYNLCEIIGISLNELNFLNINKDRIIEKLKKNRNNILIFNDFFLKNGIKKYINGNKILIPYLYSLKNQ
jgi:hypothetical protein